MRPGRTYTGWRDGWICTSLVWWRAPDCDGGQRFDGYLQRATTRACSDPSGAVCSMSSSRPTLADVGHARGRGGRLQRFAERGRNENGQRVDESGPSQQVPVVRPQTDPVTRFGATYPVRRRVDDRVGWVERALLLSQWTRPKRRRMERQGGPSSGLR
jgi:hypothetical protein